MPRYKKGPIERFAWGKFVIRGREHSEDGKVRGAGKDIMVVGDTVSEWKQREGHRLTERMVSELYDRDIDVLVIGNGVESALVCPGKVLKAIRKHGVGRVIVKPTPKACKRYNKLFRKHKRVALLAHGTC